MIASRDLLLVGGGLQNCLIALLLLDDSPDARVTLVERDDRLGGNHTWSFHATDVPAGCQPALAPAVHRHWDRYDVRFPGLERTVEIGYQTILSTELHDLLERRMRQAPHGRLLLGAEVAAVEARRVTLTDGRVLDADMVVDARGPAGPSPIADAGFQKFVGLELELAEPGPHRHPVLMDACVPQVDGFRFFYVLPFSPDRVLVEDTRFSDTPDIDPVAMRSEVLRYAAEQGLEVQRVTRQESGVLPMPYSTSRDWSTGQPLEAGFSGGFMHPATGYSFPIAIRLANLVARSGATTLSSSAWRDFLRAHRRQHRFASFLNRLLFTAYPPAMRHHVFERFYRLPEPVIERFYRLQMTPRDRSRILLGRPPEGFSLRYLRARAGSS